MFAAQIVSVFKISFRLKSVLQNKNDIIRIKSYTNLYICFWFQIFSSFHYIIHITIILIIPIFFLLKKKNSFFFSLPLCFCRKKKLHAMLSTEKCELYVYVLIVLAVGLWCQMRWRYSQFYQLAEGINGPPSYPLKGSIFSLNATPDRTDDFIRLPSTTITLICRYNNRFLLIEIMNNLKESADKYDYEPMKLWVGPFLFIGVYKPEDVQVRES